MTPTPDVTTWRTLHLFAGMGGGALGFQAARHLHGDRVHRFETVAGLDVDAEACEDFANLTGAPGIHCDLASPETRAELRRHANPKWAKALDAAPPLTLSRLRRVCQECPDVVFLSPPCKGFSALLGKKQARSGFYQALNRLTYDGLAWVLSAWQHRGQVPRLILIENVPRIQTRGAAMLMELQALLRAHGYAVDLRNHDAGELGGLAQSRRRCLLLARHVESCPRPVANVATQAKRTVGEVILPMPLPDDPEAGPVHRMPRPSWANWVRLALIPEGGDWRDLPGVLEKGQARREVHRRHHVQAWDQPAPTIAGSGSNGAANIADPRLPAQRGSMGNPGSYGVLGSESVSRTVTGKASVGTGQFAFADPRRPAHGYRGTFRVVEAPVPGCLIVPDPKRPDAPPVVLVPMEQIATKGTGRARSGQFGVLRETDQCGAVTGSGDIHNGAWAFADRRVEPTEHPDPPPVIVSPRSGKWHRPLTTLELAALQGFDWQQIARVGLAGNADGRWRERIGNAVPPPAARAVAEVLLESLAAVGDGFSLAPVPPTGTWVRPSTPAPLAYA